MHLRLTDDAAKLLESAWRELGLNEEQAEAFIDRADTLAQLDWCDRIHARHMLQSLGEREAS